MRVSSAFTLGLTHNIRGTVLRLLVFPFCERDGLVFNWCDRAVFCSVTGWREAMRSRWGALLSCPTPRSGCTPFGEDDCWGKTFCENWVCLVCSIGCIADL